MTRMSDVIANTGWLTIAYIFSRGISLIWQLLLARFLSDKAEMYGELSVLTSLSAIFIIFADFGLNVSVQQEWHKGENSEGTFMGFLLTTRLFSASMASLLLIMTTYLLYNENSIRSASCYMALSLFASGLILCPVGIWESRQEMKMVAILGMFQTGILISIQFLALKYMGTLTSLAAAIAFSSICTVVLAWITMAIKLGRPDFSMLNHNLFNKFIRLGLPVMLSSIVFVIYYRMDTILLSKWVGNESAGTFVIATLLYMGLVDLLWSQLGKALFPRLSAEWANTRFRENLYLLLSSIVKFYMVTSIIILIGIFALGRPLFEILFSPGSPWLNAWLPLLILTLGFWPIALYGLFYRLLLLEGKRHYYMIAITTVTISKLCFSFYFIPYFGTAGAALSNSVAQFMMTALTAVGLREIWKHVISLRTMLQYVILLGTISIIGWLTNTWHWGMVFLLQMGLVGIYIGCLWRNFTSLPVPES